MYWAARAIRQAARAQRDAQTTGTVYSTGCTRGESIELMDPDGTNGGAQPVKGATLLIQALSEGLNLYREATEAAARNERPVG